MPPNEPPKSHQKTVAAFAVIVIAGILVAAAVGLRAKTDDTVATTANTNSTQTTPAQSTETSSSSPTGSYTQAGDTAYKDGTYTASSEYSVPRSFETIKVSLTISGGVVTDSTITNSEGDRESAQYQEEFTGVYKSYVVGKKVSDIHLSYVAGASDTAEGFNDALDQIKQQAKS